MIKFIIIKQGVSNLPVDFIDCNTPVADVKRVLDMMSMFPGEYTVKIEGEFVFNQACSVHYSGMMCKILGQFQKEDCFGPVEQSMLFSYLTGLSLSEDLTKEAGETW